MQPATHLSNNRQLQHSERGRGPRGLRFRADSLFSVSDGACIFAESENPSGGHAAWAVLCFNTGALLGCGGIRFWFTTALGITVHLTQDPSGISPKRQCYPNAVKRVAFWGSHHRLAERTEHGFRHEQHRTIEPDRGHTSVRCMFRTVKPRIRTEEQTRERKTKVYNSN